MLQTSGFLPCVITTVLFQLLLLFIHQQLHKSNYVPYRCTWKRRFKLLRRRYVPKTWPPLPPWPNILTVPHQLLLPNLWQMPSRRRRVRHNAYPHPVNLHRSVYRIRARRAALLFNNIYICTTTSKKSRQAAYKPRTGTYYDIRCLSPTNPTRRDPMVFDSDSFNLTVDNCSSASVTNDLRDFIEPPRTSRTRIIGVTGVSSATKVGTVRWRTEDDDGLAHSILLPNTYYAREAPYKLLSPQHWSQVADDNTPEQYGTWCATYADSIVQDWD